MVVHSTDMRARIMGIMGIMERSGVSGPTTQPTSAPCARARAHPSTQLACNVTLLYIMARLDQARLSAHAQMRRAKRDVTLSRSSNSSVTPW